MMLEKNQIVQLTISDLGSEGEGIGKVDGIPFFVKDALPGDEIEAKIIKVKKNYAYARLERVLTPSPFRIEPPCKFARQCGGCQIQSLAYEKQLAFKQEKVKNNLMRIGGIAEELLDRIMEPIIGMEPETLVPLHYRNKAQYPFGTNKDGEIICGFYAGRTHSIIANTDCYLGDKINKQILEAVLAYMKECAVPAYDEATGKGLVRHVLIRSNQNYPEKQIMVCVVINGKSLPCKEKLIQRLSRIPGMHSISISPNEKNTNVILGDSYKTIWGEAKIKDSICPAVQVKTEWVRDESSAVTFEISPLSFYQVNPVQMERLYSTALEYADLHGNETVWDLYCGIGTISLFLAKKAAEVCGVEIVPQAIMDAWENAALNGIENVSFYVGKSEEVLPAFYKGEDMGKYCLEGFGAAGAGSEHDMSRPNVICVDPPRKGCDKACLDTMLKMEPERIVYVSCDSATLARDVKYLSENGYELNRVRACDMFANSVHVETVVLLSQLRQKPDNYIDVDVDVYLKKN